MSSAATLLRWYRRHGRDLPWRQTRDPYNILVSEIMLQQTQVERVKDFYQRWLKQFPDWHTLAKASNADVIHAWAGLGYNRRALTLRNIAKQIVDTGIPETEADWRSLKGIGPYTAAALSAFAQKKRALPIDTNIRRVLGRFFFGIHFPGLEHDKKIITKKDAILPRRGHYYDVPQAIFDLATMICAKDPDCARCPLKKDCRSASAFLSSTVAIPKRSVKKSKERTHRNKRHPDRIYRGRILKTIRKRGQIRIPELGALIDETFDKKQDQTWLNNMIKRLEKDGLVSQEKRHITLSKN